MNILILNHFPLEGSGSGVYTENLAKALVQSGHNVMVLIPETKPVDTRPEGFTTQIVRFREAPTVIQSATTLKTDTTKLAHIDPPVDLEFPFPCFTSHPRSHQTFYALNVEEVAQYRAVFKKKISEIIETFHPHVIHVNHLWILADLAAETGVPYVVTSHGTDIFGFKKDERYRAAALRGAAAAGGVITISEQVDQDVSTIFKVGRERRHLIHNGCDTTMFFKRSISRKVLLETLGIKEVTSYLVCFAGKFAHFKGIDVLLHAAALYESHENGAKIMTVIAGDGALREALMSIYKALDLKHVYFVGHLTQNTLAELYSISDAFVIPSRGEPFGLVALEAMACGAPVVGTDQGGLKDFIDESVGILVPVDDPEALSGAIEKTLKRPASEKRARSLACQQYVKAQFSWDGVAKKTALIYEKILK